MNYLHDVMTVSLWDTFSQLYPSKPAFTEDSLPDLEGKVYIVTGANTGIGKQLTRLLYSRNAKVYVAARSEEKATQAIADIKQQTTSKGQLVFLSLDLADLRAVRAAADRFLAIETRLDVLFNNAGVMTPENPDTNRTAQGYELQLGVNCIGTHMFTKLLTPVLSSTAEKIKQRGAVRVVWVSSWAAYSLAPHGGVPLPLEDGLAYAMPPSPEKRCWDPLALVKYGVSKAGNYLQAVEFGRRCEGSGIMSVALNPGNLRSELWRTQPGIMQRFLDAAALYPTQYGSCTLLYAGLSPDIEKVDLKESWVIPFGRVSKPRADLIASTKSEEEGGTAAARKFWDWTEEQIKPYL